MNRVLGSVWFLVGNGGMDPYVKVLYSSPNFPFPHSLLRTRQLCYYIGSSLNSGLGFRAL